MRIGIGITSYKRPEHLKLCLAQIEKHTDMSNVTLFVAEDIPNIAKAKNECLKALKDCDHIFLFDDDCFPIADGWVEYFTYSGLNHALYLNQRHNKIGEERGIEFYSNCGGCFMYISQAAFRKVGYFNTEYKQYGFEHAGWSKRYYGNAAYECLSETKDYIYSLDYQGTDRFLINHKPSITDFEAMQESIEYNRKVFEKEINSDKIYYDYEA